MYNNLENVLIMIVLFILSFGQVLTYLRMYDFFSPFWVLVSGLRVFQGITVRGCAIVSTFFMKVANSLKTQNSFFDDFNFPLSEVISFQTQLQ